MVTVRIVGCRYSSACLFLSDCWKRGEGEKHEMKALVMSAFVFEGPNQKLNFSLK